MTASILPEVSILSDVTADFDLDVRLIFQLAIFVARGVGVPSLGAEWGVYSLSGMAVVV